LKVRNLETKEEKEYFAAEQPNSICGVCTPAWSPDNGKIIFTTNIPNGTGQVFVVNLTNDKKDEIKFDKLRRFEQVAWFPDGESFVISASDGSRFFHLWKVYYPDGQIEQITNGLSTYGRVSISSNGKKILALQTDETSNLLIADAENLSEQKQLTQGKQNSFGQNGLHWIDDKRILFSVQTEQNLADNLAIINLEDGSKTPITNEKQDSFRVPVTDGKYIWFTMNKGNFAQVFQMDIDGKNIRQLTNGNDGQRISPRVTNDSKYLYYVVRGKSGGTIRRFDLQTQTEEIFFNNPDYQPGPFLELSPDNKFLTFLRIMDRPDNSDYKYNAIMTIISIENTNDIKTFPVSFVPPIRRFSPDSKAIDWIYADTDATQIVRQGFDEREPKPIYTTPEGKIFNFAWSKDGKKLAIARGEQYKDAVLLTEFDK
jgi:Tol biopolymer transport system component